MHSVKFNQKLKDEVKRILWGEEGKEEEEWKKWKREKGRENSRGNDVTIKFNWLSFSLLPTTFSFFFIFFSILFEKRARPHEGDSKRNEWTESRASIEGDSIGTWVNIQGRWDEHRIPTSGLPCEEGASWRGLPWVPILSKLEEK